MLVLLLSLNRCRRCCVPVCLFCWMFGCTGIWSNSHVLFFLASFHVHHRRLLKSNIKKNKNRDVFQLYHVYGGLIRGFNCAYSQLPPSQCWHSRDGIMGINCSAMRKFIQLFFIFKEYYDCDNCHCHRSERCSCIGCPGCCGWAGRQTRTIKSQ